MKNSFIKVKNFFRRIAPTKRRLIQLYSALLFNSYLKGYITGNIFKGITKNVCTPGLNCYSCPGAVTSCPLGALQNSFASSGKTVPYYMLGIIMLCGIIFGRWICGWLCPFGLVQDLLHKIKTPKIKKGRITKAFSFLKYAILVIFVVVLPFIYMFRDFPLPAFCKYICPAGTFGGALGLLINPANAENFGMLGFLFTWKFVLMVSIIVGSIFIYRFFCRFICPLGAIYGFFNKISLFGIKLEKNKCISCGACITTCKMDITRVGDHECISCGDCISACPTKAITWKGAKIILPENETDSNIPESKTSFVQPKNKRAKVLKIVVSSLMAVTLAASLVYFNFFADTMAGDTDSGINEDPTDDYVIGSEVGQKCPSYELELVDGNGETVSIKDFEDKVLVINFWGTWCGPCKAELPHFNELADEYSDDVVFLIIHSSFDSADAPEYISKNFPDSKMIFAYDLPLNKYVDKYFYLLGGSDYYPRTLVLDRNGVVTFGFDGGLSYDQLKAEIENALAK